MIDNLVTYYICLWEFWRITFWTDISHRGGLALYCDSKEQYNADCLASRRCDIKDAAQDH